MKKKILAITGSTKKGSINTVILRVIAELYKDVLEVEIYDGIDKLSHFNTDLDTETPPIRVKDFRERIQRADGILISTPGMCSVFREV